MSTDTPKILRLNEVVVNRIAAGEVIQRPANAIKEMIENCLDAKSTSIQVTVKSGGLKLLQITDDGCGIRKDDMPIVCERFTTSKLSKFDDLKNISTYGFRGEALASISHVAHLTITTKTSDSPCAYKAKYEDGKMVPLQPGGNVCVKPCAGNKGTQITAEDLFYNVAMRRKALKNPHEEHLKIIDVISKYSIHNPEVGFTLKKFGDNIADVRTQPNSTIVDNIKNIYGPAVAKELLEITHEDSKYGFKLHGYVSNANYSIKKCVFLLFINHRLVESSGLKKALDYVYINYLPKDKHPFMYMSLEVNPANCDVNVHPTKHEVKFLHEEFIIEQIQKCVETKLLGSNESREYYTQMLLPKMVSTAIENPISEFLSKPTNSNDEKKKLYAHQMVRTDSRERKLEAFYPSVSNKENVSSMTSSDLAYEKQTESKTLQVVTALHEPDITTTISCKNNNNDNNSDGNNNNNNNFNDDESNDVDGGDGNEFLVPRLPIPPPDVDYSPPVPQLAIIDDQNVEMSSVGEEETSPIITEISTPPHTKISHTTTSSSSCVPSATASSSSCVPSTTTDTKSIGKRKQKRSSLTERRVSLTSVKNIRQQIDHNEHLGLKNILEDHKFVGCVNRTLTLIQHLTRLYIVNSSKLSQELFYQIIQFQFGNFGFINLSSPAPIYELVLLALESPLSGWTQEDGAKEELSKFVVDLLISKRDMLLDYFSFEITEKGEILTLPLLLEKYVPNLHGLPMLLLRLATEVNWDSEQECFHTFAIECSRFYAFGPDPINNATDPNKSEATDPNKSEEKNGLEWKHIVEHVLFPTFRTSLHPPKKFSEDGTFLEIANLPDLYKVFERC